MKMNIDRLLEYYPSDGSYLNHRQSSSSQSSSTCDVHCSWATSLPVFHADSYSNNESMNDLIWKQENSKKKSKVRNSRKRTKFTAEDLEILNIFFDTNPMPSRSDISILSEKLAYPRYIVQVSDIDRFSSQ
jgi:hypothetical protein